jgi:hypothetical protein
MPFVELSDSELCYLATLVRREADNPERIGMAPSAEAAEWQRCIDLALCMKLLKAPK